jgi:hypothetical protein
MFNIEHFFGYSILFNLNSFKELVENNLHFIMVLIHLRFCICNPVVLFIDACFQIFELNGVLPKRLVNSGKFAINILKFFSILLLVDFHISP